MVPQSSSSATPAHPVPRSAPTGTTRPPRLRRAVVGGALTAALLAAGSLGLIVGIDALTAPSAAAQTTTDTAPDGDGHAATPAYDASTIKITADDPDHAETRVVITTPNGHELTITQPAFRGSSPYSDPYVTVDGGQQLRDCVDTAEARLVWDQVRNTWQLTPHVTGTFAFRASAASVRANSGPRPDPHVTLDGQPLTETGLQITFTR